MKLLIVLFVVVFFTACSPFIKPKVCQDSPSAILKVTSDNPSGLDRSLLMVNIVALEKSAYTAAQASKFIGMARTLVESGIGYTNLLQYLTDRGSQINKAAGLSIILLGSEINEIAVIGGDDLIPPCDKVLILAHLDKQLAVLSIYQ